MCTLFSWAQVLIVRIRYSTSRLFVLRSINTKSESESSGSLLATQRWNQPMQAPRFPSQYSGDGSRRSNTSNALI